MPQLHRVLYCSRNTISGSAADIAAEVRQILAVSRVNNARDGITGGLLFSQGCFAQVLEGPQAAIEATFERIQGDARHGEVVVLQCGPVAERDFPDWSMAFAGDAVDGDPLAAVVLKDAFSGQSDAGDAVLGIMKGLVARETDWLAPNVPATSHARGYEVSGLSGR